MTTAENVLIGRTARCYCGAVRPSSTDLAFFEYRGEGSETAVTRCAVCRYGAIAHDPTAPHMARVEGKYGKTRYQTFMERMGQHDFTPLGGQEFDSYYCGCRGWD